jgi:D-alanyl-D-alanine carboxypeptidase
MASRADTARRSRAKIRGRVIAIMSVLVLALAGPGVAFGRSSPRAAALTSAIGRVMRQASIPGAIVGVWQRGRDPYVKAFGVRDRVTRRPMSTDLYMRIGSETKTFTVTALLQLVDRGKVRLDDPIGKYVAGVPDGNAITLRELAEMRSGLFDYISSPAFLRALVAHPRRGWTPRQLLAYSFSRALVFAPGTRYDYSNTNFVLLGLVVQKVSHQPVAVYIKQHILEPLRLTHTSFPAGAPFPSPHAQGYTTVSPDCVVRCGRIVNATSWNLSYGWAAGAMASTLGDLRRWARAVATGELLSPATQKQRLRFIATGTNGYGYGLGLMNVNGWIGHSGLIPGYESLTSYLPSEQATIVVLINAGFIGTPHEPVLLLGHAITKIITPRHVYITG